MNIDTKKKRKFPKLNIVIKNITNITNKKDDVIYLTNWGDGEPPTPEDNTKYVLLDQTNNK